MPSTSQLFMEQIFRGKPDDQWILLWQLNGHRSSWFTDIGMAADYIPMAPDDIYFGVGVSKTDFGPTKRCPQNAITGIPGFYVDIDVKEKVAHKGKDYPISMDEAMSLVEGHGFDPTVVVNSGYGIHCYWLFEDIWMLESEPERFRAKVLSRRMNETIKKRALDIERDIDSVFDLSRVLRPVGSFNCKKKNKVEVTLISSKGPRYDPDFFDDTLDKQPIPKNYKTSPDPQPVQQEILTNTTKPATSTPAPAASPAPAPAPTQIKIDLNAQPNFEKMMDMASIFENFTETWDNQRKDLPSPSEYDMSLANFGAKVKMTDQEIANLIIAFRRRHNLEPEKCKRTKYMSETIMKAKKKVGDEAITDLEYLNLTKGTVHEVDDQRQKTLDSLSEIMSPLKMMAITKEIYGPGKKDRAYIMEVEKPESGRMIPYVIRGEWNFISNYDCFRDTIQGTEKVNKRVRIKKKEWDAVSDSLSSVVIDVRIGEAGIEEKMASWIEEYISKYNGSTPNTIIDSLNSREPFRERGHWWIFTEHFKAFVNIKDYNLPERELLSYMNSEGFYKKRKRVTPTGQAQTSRIVWRIPKRRYQI